jgi:hypothetical protein
MISEAIDRILELSSPNFKEYDGKLFSDRGFSVVRAPKLPIPSKISVISLTALVALYAKNFENMVEYNPVFHVTNEAGVDVFGLNSDDDAQRTSFVTATLKEVPKFKFNDWLGQEEFTIAIQAHVMDSFDRGYLLKAVSSIAQGDALHVADDGIQQSVTVKSGTSLAAEFVPKPRVTLQPFRTFREVKQPASEFVFRVRKGQGGMPQVALFEADGGLWKFEAMELIADYLTKKLFTTALPASTESDATPALITTATVIY